MFTGIARRGASRQGMVLVAMAAATWGTIGIAVSMLYRVAQTNALSIGFLRLAIAAPVLALVSLKFAGSPAARIPRRDLAVMGLMGAAYAGYQLCYFAAIPRIGVALAVLLNICSGPIFIALLARGFLGERVTAAMGAALIGALSGTALLVVGPGQAAGPVSLVGVGLALGAGASYAVITVCARSVADRYHPVRPLAIAFSLGALMLLPLALGQGLVLAYSAAGWALLLHIALVPTVLGYVVYLWGLRTTSAAEAAILTLLEPVISTFLAVVLFQELLTPIGVLGAVIVMGSVALLYAHKRR